MARQFCLGYRRANGQEGRPAGRGGQLGGPGAARIGAGDAGLRPVRAGHGPGRPQRTDQGPGCQSAQPGREQLQPGGRQREDHQPAERPDVEPGQGGGERRPGQPQDRQGRQSAAGGHRRRQQRPDAGAVEPCLYEAQGEPVEPAGGSAGEKRVAQPECSAARLQLQGRPGRQRRRCGRSGPGRLGAVGGGQRPGGGGRRHALRPGRRADRRRQHIARGQCPIRLRDRGVGRADGCDGQLHRVGYQQPQGRPGRLGQRYGGQGVRRRDCLPDHPGGILLRRPEQRRDLLRQRDAHRPAGHGARGHERDRDGDHSIGRQCTARTGNGPGGIGLNRLQRAGVG